MPRGTRLTQPAPSDATPTSSPSLIMPSPPRKVRKAKKEWIDLYLILYNTITGILWSYLLVLILSHLFFETPTKSVPLNPVPPVAKHPTASSLVRSHLEKVLAFALHPPASPTASGVTGLRTQVGSIVFCLVERARVTYSSHGIGVYTAFIQSAAILEVVHASLGWTRSALVTTMMQVTSRLIIVWWIGEGYESARFSPFYAPMLIAWCLAEIIRNVYYTSSLLGLTTPSHYFSNFILESTRHQFVQGITWLRYTAFYVLYPVGAGSEYALILTSFPSFTAGTSTAVEWTKGVNAGTGEGLSRRFTKWVAGWGLDTWAKIPLIVIWPASLYVLMSHMHAQRRKVLGRGSRLGGKAKAA